MGEIEFQFGIPSGTIYIQGAGPGKTIVDGMSAHRVFGVNFFDVVVIRNMTIRNGNYNLDPGGSACSHTHGGLIHNHGDLTLENVTLTGGIAVDGGALASGDCYDATSACPQGYGACATLINVTITGNQATGGPTSEQPGSPVSPGRGGAIVSSRALTLVNVTIANNMAADGSGMFAAAADPADCSQATCTFPMTVVNTIIVGGGQGLACGGIPLTSLGHNLFGDSSCAATPSDLVVSDPRLGSLRRDGTLPLLSGSPAIDAGTNSVCPATDERGVLRPQDGSGEGVAICDIGAYEKLPPRDDAAS